MGKLSWLDRDCREWTDAERQDVADVVMITARDSAGIEYRVDVGLYSEDGDRRVTWACRVGFGSTDRHNAGGAAFVEAAREQERVAGRIAGVVWGRGSAQAVA